MASIRKRGKKSYQIIVSAGYDSENKKLTKTKTVTLDPELTSKQAEKEIQRQAILFEKEVENGTYLDGSKMTFSGFIQRWLTDYAEKNLAPKTLFCYKSMINDRIIPALGHINLSKLQPTHLIEFYNNLAEPNIRNDKKQGALSGSTILKYHRIISSILQDAMQWQLITSNPACRVKPPHAEKKEAKFYDDVQAAILLNALESEPFKYRTMILLDITTGIRRGELIGLQWKHIDLESGIMDIKQSLQYLPGEGQSTKSPKNTSSDRIIQIPLFVVDILKKHKLLQKEELLKVGISWSEDIFLFTKWDGSVMHIDSVTKWFKKFVERYNDGITKDENLSEEEKKKQYLPVINFHGLRHTAASVLISKGLDIRSVSGVLGHAQPTTTINIYSHLLKSATKQAADIMDNLYAPKPDNHNEKIKQD